MNINSAVVMARSLMVEHGVGRLSFGFHDYPDRPGIVGKTHFSFVDVGSLKIGTPIGITMCEAWITSLDESEVEEIIMHEIAHALVPFGTGNCDHGPVWQAKCKELGMTTIRAKFDTNNIPDTVRTQHVLSNR